MVVLFIACELLVKNPKFPTEVYMLMADPFSTPITLNLWLRFNQTLCLCKSALISSCISREISCIQHFFTYWYM